MLSLCMIVNDEGQGLGDFLKRVNDHTDEIIVVDTGSEDNTKEIARRYGKVYSYKWEDDFSKARNFSISKATKDWILVLDADEKISKQYFLKIKETINNIKSINDKEIVKNNNQNEIMGVSFLQKTYVKEEFPFKFKKIKDKDYKGYTFRRITRLFRNDPRIKFEYPVHETVVNSIKRIGGKIKSLDVSIAHYPKNTDKKNDNYVRLLKKKIKKYPEAKFYCELGIQYLLMNEKEKAKEHMLKASKMNKHYARLLEKL